MIADHNGSDHTNCILRFLRLVALSLNFSCDVVGTTFTASTGDLSPMIPCIYESLINQISCDKSHLDAVNVVPTKNGRMKIDGIYMGFCLIRLLIYIIGPVHIHTLT